MEEVHGDEGGNESDRESEDRNERGTEVKQKGDGDKTDDGDFEEQIALKSFNGVVDEAGAVVAGNDFDAGRERGLEFGESFFHTVDDGESVHTVAHDDDAADGFAFTVPFGDALADVRAERNGAEVADEDGCAVLGGHWDGFEVLQRAQVAQAANHVASAGHFENAAADFVGGIANAVDDHGERNVVGAKFVGVDVYLILLNEAAHGGDFSDARNGFELKAKIPILEAAQFGEAVAMGTVDDGVFVDPACAGGVGADHGSDIFR